MNIVIFGLPASGKGTQSGIIAQKYGLQVISPGDIIRHKLKEDAPDFRKYKKIIRAGHLLQDEVIMNLIEQTVKKCAYSHIIFDGIPRTVVQKERLDTILQNKQPIQCVLYLKVSTSEVLARMEKRKKLFHRVDDEGNTPQNRIAVYTKQTLPVLDLYRKDSLLREVDGSLSISQVSSEIFKILDKIE